MHDDVEYPSPDAESCSSGTGSALLHLGVRDQTGAAIPGASIYVVPVAGPPSRASVTSAVTDARGFADLQVPGNEAYVVTVVFVGFMPEARALYLRQGCSATHALILRVVG